MKRTRGPDRAFASSAVSPSRYKTSARLDVVPSSWVSSSRLMRRPVSTVGTLSTNLISGGAPLSITSWSDQIAPSAFVWSPTGGGDPVPSYKDRGAAGLSCRHHRLFKHVEPRMLSD